MQDVPGYLQRKGLKYACYMDPDNGAIVDGSFAYRVNYETYLFADSTARECFRGDVVRYCGLVTDPVSKQRFRPENDGPRYEHEQVTYLFVDQDSYETFVADPELHVLPGFSM